MSGNHTLEKLRTHKVKWVCGFLIGFIIFMAVYLVLPLFTVDRFITFTAAFVTGGMVGTVRTWLES